MRRWILRNKIEFVNPSPWVDSAQSYESNKISYFWPQGSRFTLPSENQRLVGVSACGPTWHGFRLLFILEKRLEMGEISKCWCKKSLPAVRALPQNVIHNFQPKFLDIYSSICFPTEILGISLNGKHPRWSEKRNEIRYFSYNIINQ